MKPHLKILLWLLPFISACQKEPSDKIFYTDFPESIALKGQVIEIDSALFRYPFRIRVHGTYAAILDLHNSDYFYHLFSYSDMRYLTSFGRRGEAPEENLSGDDIRWKGDTLWTLDANKKELAAYLPGDKMQFVDKLNIEETILPLNFIFTDSVTCVIPDYTGEARFNWINRNGRIIRKTNQIPADDIEDFARHKTALAQAWRCFLDYNPRNGILAAATQLGEVLEIYDLKNDTTYIVQGPSGEPQFGISANYAIPSGIMGFRDVQVGERYIYAIFQGDSFRELILSEQNGKNMADGGNLLYVFSLTGTPVRKYVLDRDITSLYIDESGGTVIATDVNNDQPVSLYILSIV